MLWLLIILLPALIVHKKLVADLDRVEELVGRVYLLRRLPQLLIHGTVIPATGLTANQRTALLAFRFYETTNRAGLSSFYQQQGAKRIEVVESLREIGDNASADHLEKANEFVEPFLDNSTSNVVPESRTEVSSLLRTKAGRIEPFLPELLRRIVLYVDQRSHEFPPLRRKAGRSK